MKSKLFLSIFLIFVLAMNASAMIVVQRVSTATPAGDGYLGNIIHNEVWLSLGTARYWYEIQPNTAGTVRYLHVRVRNAQASTINGCVSLHDSSGNYIAHGEFSATNGVGEYTVDIGEQVLTAATDYILAVTSETTWGTSGGVYQFKDYTDGYYYEYPTGGYDCTASMEDVDVSGSTGPVDNNALVIMATNFSYWPMQFGECIDAYSDYEEGASGMGSAWVETYTSGYIQKNAAAPTCTGCDDWSNHPLRFRCYDSNPVYTTNTLDSEQTTLYLRQDFMINTHGSNEESVLISRYQDNTNDNVLEVFLKESGTDIYLDFEVDGVAVADYGPINMDTSYRIDFYYSGTGASDEWQLYVNQGIVGKQNTLHASGDANNTGIRYLQIGAASGDPDSTLDLYVDNILLCTNGWCPE